MIGLAPSDVSQPVAIRSGAKLDEEGLPPGAMFNKACDAKTHLVELDGAGHVVLPTVPKRKTAAELLDWLVVE